MGGLIGCEQVVYVVSGDIQSCIPNSFVVVVLFWFSRGCRHNAVPRKFCVFLILLQFVCTIHQSISMLCMRLGGPKKPLFENYSLMGFHKFDNF